MRHGTTRPRRSPLLLLACAGALAACGSGDGAVDAGAAALSVQRRADDPVTRELRAAIDAGDVELCEVLLGRLDRAALPVEAPLLEARVAFLRDDEGAWLRGVEEARGTDPRDPRPYATACELWSAAGELAAAGEELRRGVEAAGRLTPELARAKAVLSLVTPGGAHVGLRILEDALADDPGLPFTARPLGQAHLLAGRSALSRGDATTALEHARRAREVDATDVETRRFLADALMLAHERDEAIATLEELLADGVTVVEPELARWHKDAGFEAQLGGDGETARRHYLRARELGMPEHVLATGAHFLRDEAREEIERAVEAHRSGDADAAARRLERAAELTPDVALVRQDVAAELAVDAAERMAAEDDAGASEIVEAALFCDPACRDARGLGSRLALRRAVEAYAGDDAEAALAEARRAVELDGADLLARQFLGQLHFDAARYTDAAREWGLVVEGARVEGETLEDPVHLHLARAEYLAGRVPAAVEVLDAYLLLEPTGPYVEETRRLLATLRTELADDR